MSADSLGEKYKKEEHQNHIFNTPDTYVGGCDLIVERLLFTILYWLFSQYSPWLPPPQDNNYPF